MSGTLILTVTRACNLRCSYCPTVKDGWPSLTPADAKQAVDLFADRYGGGDIKMFGGEPLLVPDTVAAAVEAAETNDAITRVYVSTNGLGLSAEWLQWFRGFKKGVLTVSMDGAPEDHRRHRKALDGIPDAYDHVVALMPELLRTPRVVVTQTIPPATAERAAQNFAHLRGLGFWRFNFLPGYFIGWRDDQLLKLTAAFDGIAAQVRESWAKDERLYIRNLFTRAPTPFFNSGLIVDADKRIHPSNVGLSGSLAGLLDRTCVGTLDEPPTAEVLARASAEINGLLQETLPEKVWASTLAADAQLTRFCEGLYPAYLEDRARRRAVA